tara:strand:- start:8337 stop:9011 length:675 start_codon:yes stop_codon:yes gene_type:complete
VSVVYAEQNTQNATKIEAKAKRLSDKKIRIQGLTVNNNPYFMIDVLANKTFDRVKREERIIKKDPNHLKKIVEEELLPYVDNRYASYKVLSPYLKRTTADERMRFVKAFTNYMITNYAQTLTLYDDQKFVVEEPKNVDKVKLVSVDVIIKQTPKNKRLTLQFKARRSKKGDWKIYDLVAESVSVLVSKQAEIRQLMRNNKNSLNAVIQLLEEKAAVNIELKNKR